MVSETVERRGFYVYVIFRLDGTPCYVGKGRKNRWKQHAKYTHNPRLRAIYERSATDLPVVLARQDLTHDEAMVTEIALIKAIGRGNVGPLVNFTDGGEGNLGWKPTPETRSRMNAKKKGVPLSSEHCAALSASGKGRPKSPAHIEKMRARMIGQNNPRYGKTWKADPAGVAKTAAKLKGRQPSEKCLAAGRAANTGRIPSEETRAKMSRSAHKTKSPEHAAKIAAALRGKKKSSQHIANWHASVWGNAAQGKLPL